MSDALCPEGYSLVVCSTGETLQEERAAIAGLRQQQTNGLIIAPASKNGNRHLAVLAQQEISFVLVDPIVEDVIADSVCMQNRESTREAIDYLIAKGIAASVFFTIPA